MVYYCTLIMITEFRVIYNTIKTIKKKKLKYYSKLKNT